VTFVKYEIPLLEKKSQESCSSSYYGLSAADLRHLVERLRLPALDAFPGAERAETGFQDCGLFGAST